MNAWLEATGQIAAIIICLFAFVFILLAVVFNLAMAFGLSWLATKINAIKMLRPTVESVNKATESALQGTPPDENQPTLIRAAASIPTTMQNVEKKVDQGTEKVADAVIEFRARTVQAKTILQAFFLPGSLQKSLPQPAHAEANLQLGDSHHETPAIGRPATTPVESPPNSSPTPPLEQVQHAPTH